MKLRRRSFLAAAALGSIAPSLLAQEPAYRTLDMEWGDASRNRVVPVRLYLPTAMPADRALPLIVFSHGIGGSRMGYSYLGSHWASNGFASLHLQHVGSDRSVWTGGNPLSVVSRLRDAAQESEAINRVHDLRFALDRVLASEVGARLDARRIIAAGHSYGANTTLLASGARVERASGAIDLHDPRIRLAIVISAPPFYGEPALQRILAPIRVPSLHVTCTEDIIRIPGYYSGAEDRVAVYEATGSARKALAVFEGGSHSMFTDRAGTGGISLNPQVKEATRELTTAFVRSVLEGDDGALREWPHRHAGIVAKFVSTG